MKSTYKTKAREEIMAYLKEHTEQRFTAREIFEAVSGKAEGINRTTVYRNYCTGIQNEEWHRS